MSLLKELRRRNVVRVAVAYTVGAWLVLQITDVMLGNLAAPAWVFPAVLAILAVGLVLAVFLAWVYELTPDGVVRSDDVEPGTSITPSTGRKLNLAIIGMLAVAVIVLLVDKLDLGQIRELERSIAVLPLRTLSSVVEDDYFADGIHDDLLTQLAKLSSLDKVISRTSTERYRDTTMSMQDIGDELDVATILEGGVQRSGTRVRINMQLIDTTTDEHLWAKTYERELTAENLFAIQSEITREVVSALHAVLSEDDEKRIDAAPTDSLEAHREYALGRREMAKRTVESLGLAVRHFESAVALDPEYADAWVGLADSLYLRDSYSRIDFEDTMEQRRAAIDTALALDPTSGKAYTALATLFERRSDDGVKAEEYYLKAIELNPNYATAYQWYGILLDRLGRGDEALPYVQKAVELEPLAPVLAANLSYSLWNAGRVEDAKNILMRSISINPDFPGAHAAMGAYLWQEGRLDESLRWYDEAVILSPENPDYYNAQCGLHLSLGLEDLAEICVDELEAVSAEWAHGMRLQLFAYQERYEDADILIARMKEDGLNGLEEDQIIGYYFNAGDVETGASMLREKFPDVFEDKEYVVRKELPYLLLAAVAGTTLILDGEIDQGNALLDQCLKLMQTMNRSLPPAYKDMDLYIHTVRGDLTRARSTLRDMIQKRVIVDSWLYDRAPILAELLEDPESAALLKELGEVVAEQRQWYLDHKDEPLF